MRIDRMFEFFFGCSPGVFPKRAVINPFIPVKHFKNVSNIQQYFGGNLYSGFIAEKNERDLAVIHAGIGPALCGDAVLLLEAAGVKEIVFAGTCGALGGLAVGDHLVVDGAYNGEGFSMYHSPGFILSKHFMPEKYIAGNAGCLSDLENFMKGLEAPHKVGSGRVFTIGSILSESPGFLMALKDKGIAAIDMEISAVYTAAREAGIRASALLVVSDLPLEKGIEEGLDLEAKKVFNNSVRAMSDAVLDFIVRQ